MRILFICNSATWGGAEAYVASVAGSFAQRGHDVRLAVPAGSPLAKTATARDIPTIPLRLGPKLSRRSIYDLLLRWPRYAAHLRHLLSDSRVEHGIEIVHLQFKKEQLLGTHHAKQLGLGVVWTEHGALPRQLSRLPPARFLYRRAARHADRILCVSRHVGGDMLRHGTPESKLRVCYNGIDPKPSDTSDDRVEIRREFGLGPDEPTVGVVSRLARAKGYAQLLDAVPELVRRFPTARFVIVGDGPERGSLAAKVEASEVTDNVIFAGHRHDVDRILPAFDVFACPSLAEGMPYSVMEAMRAGLPIVASRVGGLPELLADGEAGVLVEAGDPDALAAAIGELLGDATARARFGTAARARVVDAFSLESMIDCTEHVFEETRLEHVARLDGRS